MCNTCLVPDEGMGSPGTGITGGCELQCGYWEPNLGHLQEQHVDFVTESSPDCNLVRQDFLSCSKNFLSVPYRGEHFNPSTWGQRQVNH